MPLSPSHTHFFKNFNSLSWVRMRNWTRCPLCFSALKVSAWKNSHVNILSDAAYALIFHAEMCERTLKVALAPANKALYTLFPCRVYAAAYYNAAGSMRATASYIWLTHVHYISSVLFLYFLGFFFIYLL